MKWLCLLLLTILFNGCAAAPLEWRDPQFAISWPPPPNPPRISYLRQISSPDDIIPVKGRMDRFMDLLTGDRPPTVKFQTPYGVATDNDSVLYSADTSAGLVHRYDLARREVTFLTQAKDEPLETPVGVAVDREGNVYVSDSGRGKVHKYSRGGDYVRELKGPSSFGRPAGIAVNAKGEKFVVDVVARKVLVFNAEDAFVRSFPGDGSKAELASPSNVAVDRDDNIYVTDTMNFAVSIFDYAGNLLRTVGEVGDTPGSFARPKGVAVDSDGHIYVVDSTHDNFQIFDNKGNLLLFIGRNGDGPGEFYLPSGIFIDNKDRIFVTDTYNHRIQVFQYLKEGLKK